MRIRPAAEDGSAGQINNNVVIPDGFLPFPPDVRVADEVGKTVHCYVRFAGRRCKNGDRVAVFD